MKERMPMFGQKRSFLSSRVSSYGPCKLKRQGGGIAIMSVGFLFIILGFFALAFDLSRIYNRRAEMHALSSTVAVAATRHLDGTTEGIVQALAAAKDVVEGRPMGPYYEYKNKMTWNDNAISFSASQDGSSGWKTSGEAKNAAADLMYAKVDTGALDAAYGQVNLLFAPILSSSLRSVNTSDRSIAGRARLNVTPLGICAMSPVARSKRANPSGTQYDELLEYGFRRGVSYDLMQLNPDGTGPVSFQIDPVRLAGGASTGANFTPWIYRQYICSGTVGLPKVAGAKVAVQGPFPISTYFTHLNSRFDPYTGTCDVHTSPPDTNVKQYVFGSISWMNPRAGVQSALKDPTNSQRLQTVADHGPPNHTVAADYGPLWTFARAVPWSSYESQGAAEPAGGYTPFAATSAVWQALYGDTSAVGAYPNTTPYFQPPGSPSGDFSAPTSSRKPGKSFRRVLNIPLLSCPVTGSEADVLAVAKFLMTIPASSTAIYAEFGGLSSDNHTGGTVEIYR